MEAPGLKRYIMVVVGLHEMMVDVNGNFGSFIISARWGEQCEVFENCFISFVFIYQCVYLKFLEDYR